MLGDNLPRISYVPGSSTTLVVTTYLDTPDREYFRAVSDSRKGSSVKVRVREYLSLHDADRSVLGMSENCYLERKERTGTIRFKERIELSKDVVSEAIEGQGDHLNATSEIAALRREVMEKRLTPVLLSLYERLVWGSDSQLRVTFDERLRFFHPPGGLYENGQQFDPAALGVPAGLGPPRILEVKQSATDELPAWLETLLGEIPASDDYSKFVNGMGELKRDAASAGSLTRPVIAIK